MLKTSVSALVAASVPLHRIVISGDLVDVLDSIKARRHLTFQNPHPLQAPLSRTFQCGSDGCRTPMRAHALEETAFASSIQPQEQGRVRPSHNAIGWRPNSKSAFFKNFESTLLRESEAKSPLCLLELIRPWRAGSSLPQKAAMPPIAVSMSPCKTTMHSYLSPRLRHGAWGPRGR